MTTERDDRAVEAAALALSRLEFDGVLPHDCTWEGLASGRSEEVHVALAAYFAALDPITLLNEACAAFENAVGTTYGVSHGMRAALEALGLITPDTEEPT